MFQNNQARKIKKSPRTRKEEKKRVGHIVLPHLNLTFSSVNVLFNLAKKMICTTE